jgi:hypothetical protein
MNSQESLAHNVRVIESCIAEFTKTKDYAEIEKVTRKLIEKINENLKREPLDLKKALDFEYSYLQAKLKQEKDPLTRHAIESGLYRVLEAKYCLETADNASSYYCASCFYTFKMLDALGLPKDAFRQYTQTQIKEINNFNKLELLPFQKEINRARVELIKKSEAEYIKRQISLMISIAENKPESAPAKNFVTKLTSGRLTSAKKQILEQLSQAGMEIRNTEKNI